MRYHNAMPWYSLLHIVCFGQFNFSPSFVWREVGCKTGVRKMSCRFGINYKRGCERYGQTDRRAGRKMRCITIDNESPEGKTVLVLDFTNVLPASHEQTLEPSVLTARSDRICSGDGRSWCYRGGHAHHDYTTRSFSYHTTSSPATFLSVTPSQPREKCLLLTTPHSSYFLYYAGLNYAFLLIKQLVPFVISEEHSLRYFAKV